MGIARIAGTATLTLFLGACGGGGGGGDGGPSPAQGLYIGSTSDGRSVSGYIFADGSVWMAYSTVANDNVIAGFVRANSSASNGELELSSGRDYNLEGLGVSSFNGTGTYQEQVEFETTLRFSGGTTRQVSADYSDVYNDTPTMAALQGTYSATAGGPSFDDQVTFTISSSGAVSGSSNFFDCDFTGQATPRADANAYNLQITFSGGECAAPGETVRGIASYNAAEQQMIGLLTLSDRSDGAVFVGNKN